MLRKTHTEEKMHRAKHYSCHYLNLVGSGNALRVMPFATRSLCAAAVPKALMPPSVFGVWAEF